MGDARLYLRQIEALSSSCTIHVPVLTGATVSDMANPILCSSPLRFAQAGLSLGGIVAMEILAQAPERVQRIALLDTVAGAEQPRIGARREAQIGRVARDGLESVMRSEMLPHRTAEGPHSTEIRSLALPWHFDWDRGFFGRQWRALYNRPDQSQMLGRARLPAQVLCGSDDRLCPPAQHHIMQTALAGSTLAIVEGAGHLPVLEKPIVNSALSRWLAA